MKMVTNKDAKMIYSKYWFKHMSLEMFPTIYIDEYWEYTIDLFNLRDDWEWFLKVFNKEFSSAKEYIEESERVKDEIMNNFYTYDIKEKLLSYKIDNYHFPFKNIYDIPEGVYWVIDLVGAFNLALKYLDVIKPGTTYDNVLEKVTKSELLKKSKVLRVQSYYKLDAPFKRILYNVCDKILYQMTQTKEFNEKVNSQDIVAICGDSLYIPISKNVELVEGDCTIGNVCVHVKKMEIKSVMFNGEKIKWLNTNSTCFFYKNNYPQYVSTDEYLCLMKTIKNQQLNQIDKTVGYEEEIFYVMD